MKYECKICGYIYDSEEGDADYRIEKGTTWEQLPEDWKCPLCKAPKSDFVDITENQ